MVFKDLPTGVPNFVKPDYSKIELAKLKATVRRCKKVGAFNDDNVSEWNQLLNDLQSEMDKVNSAEEVDVSNGK